MDDTKQTEMTRPSIGTLITLYDIRQFKRNRCISLSLNRSTYPMWVQLKLLTYRHPGDKARQPLPRHSPAVTAGAGADGQEKMALPSGFILSGKAS